jgi:hypothetical protein
MGLLQKAWDFLYWGLYFHLKREKPSPVNRIPAADVQVLPGAGPGGAGALLQARLGPTVKPGDVWVTPVADSNSMDPWFDATDRVVLVKSDGSDVKAGDVVIYAKEGDDSDLIIHQVVAEATDGQGAYFVCKGLNNALADAARVRPAHVRWVMVGVLY